VLEAVNNFKEFIRGRIRNIFVNSFNQFYKVIDT